MTCDILQYSSYSVERPIQTCILKTLMITAIGDSMPMALPVRKDMVTISFSVPRRFPFVGELLFTLEGATRYAGFLLAPTDGFGRGRGLFLPFGKKKAFCIFLAQIFVIFGD